MAVFKEFCVLCTASNRQNCYGNLPDIKAFFKEKIIHTKQHLVGFPSSEVDGYQLTMYHCRTSTHKQNVLKCGGNQETFFITRGITIYVT
jgi:hypothetical protein